MNKIKFLPIISRNNICKIPVNSILYIYRANRKLLIITDSGFNISHEKMDDLEWYLGPDFCRCMSGCIVNITRIKDMLLDDRIVLFDDGRKLKLGRDSFVRLKQRYKAYLRGLILHASRKSSKKNNAKHNA